MNYETRPFDPYAGLGEDGFYIAVDRLVDSGQYNYNDARTQVRGGITDNMVEAAARRASIQPVPEAPMTPHLGSVAADGVAERTSGLAA